jgi:hypothetical protein
LIDEEPHTPLDQAIKETLFEIGCLSANVSGFERTRITA